MRHFTRPDGRQYSICSPAQDLLGDWVILSAHGRQGTRLGVVKTYVVQDLASVAVLEARIARLRVQHDYQEVLA
jgi:hypothetical protein